MAKITHTIHGLTNGVTYYGKVYSVNPKKRANNRADLAVLAAIPYHSDGNTGGKGAGITNGSLGWSGSGKAGFVKISRGNTNIVA